MAAENTKRSNSFKNPTFIISSSKLKIFMKHTYHYLVSHAVYILIIPSLLSIAIHHDLPKSLNSNQITTIAHLYNLHHHMKNTTNIALIISLSSLSLITLFCLIKTLCPKKVYLLDFACYKHDPAFLMLRENVKETMLGHMSPESLEFTGKVMDRSGVGDQTFVYGWRDFPPESKFTAGWEEAEIVISGAVDDLLAKTGVDPRHIGIVIVNISAFNPVPSLSAMIVNRYKLREDVLSYNLGGMGCSAGIIALDLAKRLLQVQRNSYALIMSLESVTSSYYVGDDKSKLVSMCLFRMGGAAILLSNRSSDGRVSKYELKHTIRTHLGANDDAYKCVVQEPDKDGKIGITLSKNLMAIAGEALKANITALGPLVLPVSEQLLFLATFVARKVFKMKSVSPYVPDFKLAFEHFCVHAGGKGVLDEVETNLKLTKWDMEASRMTLYRYSNTSSSSLWYELAYTEAKGRIRKGDRVWQIGFGSGFKCGSAVWKALKTINPKNEDNPWTHVIHQFPVN